MPSFLRAFIALEFPAVLIEALQPSWQALCRREPGIRRVPPSNWHITLKFLGDIPAAEASWIGQQLREIAAQETALQLGVKGIGVFPDVRRPRVLWAGLSGDTARLQRMQHRIEQALHTRNPNMYPLEKRKFTAHLTLGRIKSASEVNDLVQTLERFATLDIPAAGVDRLVLKQSTLTSKGAVYTDIEAIVMQPATPL